MPRVERLVIGASLGAVAAGALLFWVGRLLDPARATRRALSRR